MTGFVTDLMFLEGTPGSHQDDDSTPFISIAMEAYSYRVWDRRARRMLTCPDDGIIISRLPGQTDQHVYWFNRESGEWELVEEA